MKRYLLIFSAFVAMVACNKEPEIVPAPAPLPTRTVEIDAVATKTTLDGNSILWESTDKIAVFFSNDDSKSVSELSSTIESGNTAAKSRFSGEMAEDVTSENGYDELGYAVYPSSAVNADGEIVYELPSVQTAHASGSFLSDVNLSSSKISLADIEDDGQATANFLNALSVLRVTLSEDVTSVTVTGSAPFAGKAPVAFDKDGSLLVQDGGWTNASESVTLLPANGTNFEAKTYNIVVWPGEQKGLSITLNFNELGGYSKTYSVSAEKPSTFAPAKYYNLKVLNTEELVIEEMLGGIVPPTIDPELEENVEALLSQIQSVSLMTEYLDNSVYARYAQMTYSKQKIDVSLDYIIRPEAAAEALVEAFNQDSRVVSALLAYGKGAGLEIQEQPLAVKELLVKDLAGVGKVVTATVDASSIDNKFYDGDWDASVALQIASGETDVISDFAKLVPKAGSVISGYNLIPAVPGARVVIPFSYAVSGDASYTLEVTASQGVAGTSMNYYDNSKTGNLTVSFAEGAIQSPSVTLTLTVGEGENQEVISHDFTFTDSGSRIEFVDPGQVDYIGGEITLGVNTQNIQSYSLSCGGDGISQSGSIFTFNQNNGNQRTVSVECQATISGVSFNYYKSITITQKAYGTALSKTYYTNGQKVVLNQANASGCSNYFNIVILGDGYQKKDLVAGGKFERSARSAMDSFFAIEPYKTFKDRFNVYMVAYESVDEGTDIKSSSIDKNTYFGSYCQGGGNTAAYVADTAPVINAVKAAVGSGDATYYRSIAILLINTDEQAGSTGYPFRDYKSGWPNGYASFAIAALAANSTGTNGLIKHEAGGHAFGRLADEYYTNGTTASSENKSELSNWHAKGWYWNVNPTNSGNYYQFTNSDYSSEISYIEGAWGYQYGIYRPTQGGMMQGSTGVFNAPSRHAIYHRIITESQGVSAYSWSNFKNYDQKNR